MDLLNNHPCYKWANFSFLHWFTSKEFSSFSSLFFYFICRQIFIKQNFFVSQKLHYSSHLFLFIFQHHLHHQPHPTLGIYLSDFCVILSSSLPSYFLILYLFISGGRGIVVNHSRVRTVKRLAFTLSLIIRNECLFSSLSLSHSGALLKTFEEKLLTHLPFSHLFRFHCYLNFLEEENSDCNCLVRRGKWLRKMHYK